MNAPLSNDRKTFVALAIILFVALALRLSWVLIIDPSPKLSGGDGPFYLALARAWAKQESIPLGWYQAAGPLYPLYLSLFYWALPEEAVLPAARIGQAALDTLMCLAAFDLGRRVFDVRAGLLAAAALALDLRFIAQVGAINTETLFIFLLVGGVWAFVVARSIRNTVGQVANLSGAVVIFLLAAFTRAIALPIPILLAGSLLLPRPSRAQWLTVGGVVGLAGIMVGGWAVRNYQTSGQWIMISDGLAGNFWLGSRGDGQWHGVADMQQEIDALKARYGRLAYVEDTWQTIASNPLAYGRLLVVKAAAAYLQPYGTVPFPGESLKDLALSVLRGQMSWRQLIAGESFWPKLIIYIFHFTGLFGGLLGMWLTRREWLKVLPLTLPIVYLTLAYTLLTIIPRYIFPAMPFYMLLAAYVGVKMFDRRHLYKSVTRNS